MTPRQRAELEEQPEPQIPELTGNSRLARAYLWERLNEPEAAATTFAQEIVALGRGHRREEAAQRYLKLKWYQQGHETRKTGAVTVGFRAARAVDRRLPTRSLPSSAGRRLRRAHIMLLSSVYGEHDAALSLARGAEEGDPATWIVRAKALRNQGHCEQALAASIKASEYAVPANGKVRPDEATHAMFERVFALIWLGRWDDAEEELSLLYGGNDGQAAARWLGWSRYLRGGLKLLRREDGAGKELRDAKAYFASDDEGGRRALACDVLLRAVERGDGRPDPSELTIPPISLAVIDQLKISADVEVAEAARAVEDPDLDLAMRKYQPVADLVTRPLLSTAALIGIAEISLAKGSFDRTAATEAEHRARRSGLRHLEAAAIITSCRGGDRSVHEAARLLDPFADVIPGEGSPADRVGPVLTDPDQVHSIYCVW